MFSGEQQAELSKGDSVLQQLQQGTLKGPGLFSASFWVILSPVTSDDSLDLSQTAAKAGRGALHCKGGTESKLKLPGETTAVF